MAVHRLVVIGASTGGIEALSRILERLPGTFEAPIFVVIHISPDSPGYLPEILARKSGLNVVNAKDGEAFVSGKIYVAPPDRHLIIEAKGRLRTPRGPRENRSRPAVDPLFRSAALAFGPRVIGVILSGGLDDGSAGLRAVKLCGGTTIVQDPADANVDSMPNNALAAVDVDFCKPAIDIAPLLMTLVDKELREPSSALEDSMRKQLQTEVNIAKNPADAPAVKDFGIPSIFTCPECHGTLLRLRGDRPVRFRCHTGHAFTADSLMADLDLATDNAVWNAVRTMQEGAMLLSHMADHWEPVDPTTAHGYRQRARKALERVELLRSVTEQDSVMPHPPEVADAT